MCIKTTSLLDGSTFVLVVQCTRYDLRLFFCHDNPHNPIFKEHKSNIFGMTRLIPTPILPLPKDTMINSEMCVQDFFHQGHIPLLGERKEIF